MVSKSFENNPLKAHTLLLVGISEDLATHTRIPEILQVLGYAFRPFRHVWLRFEKGCNIVGHLNQMRDIHWREREALLVFDCQETPALLVPVNTVENFAH